jgi:hypothetical protein
MVFSKGFKLDWGIGPGSVSAPFRSALIDIKET